MQSAAERHLLVLNAAEGLLQLVIAGREREGGGFSLLASQAFAARSRGVELLAPALADACARLRILPGDIGLIAAVRGPGGFTGLRLALAAAAGLARTVGALQAGMDYLPLLAHSALMGAGLSPSSAGQKAGPEPARRLWVLTHARRQLVHMQGFAAGPEGAGLPVARSELLVLAPQEAAERIAREGREQDSAAPALVLGSGLTRNRELIADILASAPSARPGQPAFLLLPPRCDHPLPDALLDAAARLSFTGEDILPLYARPSDAEENIIPIAKTLRLDPEEARQALNRLTGKRA